MNRGLDWFGYVALGMNAGACIMSLALRKWDWVSWCNFTAAAGITWAFLKHHKK